jgi:hypothetical protein
MLAKLKSLFSKPRIVGTGTVITPDILQKPTGLRLIS